MSKCQDCRKNDAYFTRWERIRSWLAWHLFPNDLHDERANAFTQGFGDGYAMARKHLVNNQMDLDKIMYNREERYPDVAKDKAA